MGDVAIYTELGRFMMGPYGCLVTKAIHEKHTHKEYIGVDSCAVNLMRPAMYGAYHHILFLEKRIRFAITCMISQDLFARIMISLQFTIVIISHGKTMCASIMNHQIISHINLRKITVNWRRCTQGI